MIDNEYLLTYYDEGNNTDTFKWFDCEEEMNDFIIKNNITSVIEKIRIKDSEAL